MATILPSKQATVICSILLHVSQSTSFSFLRGLSRWCYHPESQQFWFSYFCSPEIGVSKNLKWCIVHRYSNISQQRNVEASFKESLRLSHNAPLFHPKIATQWNQDGKDRVKPDEKVIAFNPCNSKTASLVVDLSSALEVMNVIMAQRISISIPSPFYRVVNKDLLTSGLLLQISKWDRIPGSFFTGLIVILITGSFCFTGYTWILHSRNHTSPPKKMTLHTPWKHSPLENRPFQKETQSSNFKPLMFRGKLLLSERVPSRELTYPTLGKVKLSTQYVSSLEHKCRVILITHTVDDSEIPFPTTVWMYPKNLVDNGDFNYQPGEFTGFLVTITRFLQTTCCCRCSITLVKSCESGSAVKRFNCWMSGIQNPQESKVAKE